jgi:Metal-dependent proteases with possible chaperone activity
MAEFLGFDTSNYTTSVAVVNSSTVTANERILLEVAEGGRGLRQSDALFAHTVNLPTLTAKLGRREPAAVGCSVAPRDVPGSYMPCFLAGIAAASAVADLSGVPLYKFSHQAGHIAAALYGCGKLELWRECGEFLAYHVSGGTTELLHVKSRTITKLGGVLDISAGKAVDRIGVMLGLHFPCGPALEELANKAESLREPIKISVTGCDFNLSGLENKAAELLARGAGHPEVALYTLTFIVRTLTEAAQHASSLFPGLPIICAGGVMSNKLISAELTSRFDAYFAPPGLSCDNAAGVALLTETEYENAKHSGIGT